MDAAIAELRLQLAKLETRMTQWTFVCTVLTFSIVAILVVPTLRGPLLGLFIVGTVVQCVAIWRMGTRPTEER